ncbi:hypothetical protein FRC10_004607 [Ceratobasidium sp. 414]|nr:hypothetical protein FRC10_004607 [Ceratobasidium sp. 414]
MIVQGLVQTIEVSRPPPFLPSTPVSPTEPSDNVIPSEPIRQSRASEHAKPSSPTIAGGDAPEPVSTPATGLSTPSTSTAPSSSTTSNPTPTTTPPDTPPSISSAPSNPMSPTSSPTPIRANPSSQSPTTGPTSPPSSIDVLGLLLRYRFLSAFLSSSLTLPFSIAAQATAEALVPWSVPPRSRNLSSSPPSGTGRDGIANGLAAAFSALAAGGAGARASTSTSMSAGAHTEAAASTVAVETSLPTPAATVVDPTPTPAPVPVAIPRPRLAPPPRASSFSRRLSTFSSRRASIISNRRASAMEPQRAAEEPRRRTMSMLGDTVRRFMPWRSGAERVERGDRRMAGEEVADFARAPPSPNPIVPVESADIPVRSETPVASTPTIATPPEFAAPSSPTLLSSPTVHTSLPPPPVPMPLPPPPVPTSLPPPPVPSLPPRPRPRSHPTTDAEDLVRFSHMLGFTPGAVHPSGSFERFLADMQDELRSALSEYQERTRVRSPERRRRSRATSRDSRRSSREERSRDRERRGSRDGERRGSRDWDVLEEEPEPRVSMDRLDHNRPHVPSTDPLPLNWWRMYRFPSLPDVAVPAAGSPAPTVTIGGGSNPESPNTSNPSTMPGTPSPSIAPGPESDVEPPVPVHPAIIIGLRSVSRDPLEEVAAAAGTAAGGAGTRRSTERRSSASTGVDAEPRPSSMGDTPWARRFGLRDRDREEIEDRRSRDGTRNYIIWIIGGYYPSNHPLLAHPNLFLGQVHPDELWMLNEFLGQVKPPTASREDIANAGLRVIKGAQVGELAKDGSVTENCTERVSCLLLSREKRADFVWW